VGVGKAGAAPLWDVRGTRGAAPVWAEIMGYLHAREPSRAPVPPAGVVRIPVRYEAELEAARDEWFIAGTEQPLFASSAPADDGRAAPGRIMRPADGSIVALDPDIPPDRQRVRFEATGHAVQWRIDGKPFVARTARDRAGRRARPRARPRQARSARRRCRRCRRCLDAPRDTISLRRSSTTVLSN
jgi:penicillin-binding protein 1C